LLQKSVENRCELAGVERLMGGMRWQKSAMAIFGATIESE
jgi:hypothetical protein